MIKTFGIYHETDYSVGITDAEETVCLLKSPPCFFLSWLFLLLESLYLMSQPYLQWKGLFLKWTLILCWLLSQLVTAMWICFPHIEQVAFGEAWRAKCSPILDILISFPHCSHGTFVLRAFIFSIFCLWTNSKWLFIYLFLTCFPHNSQGTFCSLFDLASIKYFVKTLFYLPFACTMV